MNTRDASPALTEALMVDAEHPWLGLASFTETTRAFFYGREEEVAELTRRVQRKTLTVLFGQSGLGKTSILNAGVVPKLRGQGFCPVYVRIAYDAEAPSPSEQIKQAIQRAARSSGRWTQAGVATEGETLWEFLHHRDDQLLDEEGKPVLPLLIFDQFEEIFTVGQADEAGRERAARFIADLADLVENRAPQALEAKLLDDDNAFEGFDFTRSDYRVLISLREDYLAHLEGLKGQMPSITQNRMRLAPMNGTQALAAVRGPGGALVNEEVAEAIVRFVAGGSELVHAEVEPSLLSLICRELNDTRLAQGRSEISVDLLAGSHAAILSDFYERALADQPPALRRFIEDTLLTDSGYRENVAEERVRHEFEIAGAAPDALALLVNRRLLRVEERLDLRRVELTHDVLCSVVKASRDMRREREALEASERLLAEQRDRARLARRQLRQARLIATVCIVLSIGALIATGLAYQSSQRAKAAEQAADRARNEAEGLLTFLMDDFYQELEPLGRLDIVQQLSQRAVDYYKGLPDSLRNRATERNHALALLRHGYTLQSQNRTLEGGPLLADALKRLEALRAAGDNSEPTLIGTGLALRALSRQNMQDGSAPKALEQSLRGAALLHDAASAPSASHSLRLANAQVLQYLGYVQLRMALDKDAIQNLQASQAAVAPMLDSQPLDERATYFYVAAAPWLMEALFTVGRYDDVLTTGQLGLQRSAELLKARPGHRSVIASRALISNDLAQLEGEKLHIAEAIRLTRISASDWAAVLQNDRSNGPAWNNLAVAHWALSIGLHEAGQVDQSAKELREALSLIANTPETIFTLVNASSWQANLVTALTEMGDVAQARRELQGLVKKERALIARASTPLRNAMVGCMVGKANADLLLALGDARAVTGALQAPLAAIRAVEVKSDTERVRRLDCEKQSAERQLEAHVRLGEFEQAEQLAAQVLALIQPEDQVSLSERRDLASLQTWQALAQARQGRLDAARSTLAPALKLHLQLAPQSRESPAEQDELARTLYVQALADPHERRALLARSQALLQALPAEMRALRSTQMWLGWVQQAEQRKGGA